MPELRLPSEDGGDQLKLPQEVVTSTVTDDLDLGELQQKYKDCLEAQYQAKVVELYRGLKRRYEEQYGFTFSAEDEMVKFIIGMADERQESSRTAARTGAEESKIKAEYDTTAVSNMTTGEFQNSQTI